LFDNILRLQLQNEYYDKTTTGELLKAVVKFHGSKRMGPEKKLFIKTDSWHLMFYKQLRLLYPETPFIILFRTPVDVLRSNQHKKGMQACYNLIEPELFGLHHLPDEQTHPDLYMPLVLEKYFEAIIEICTTDTHTLLLNYNQGLMRQMEEIADYTGIELDPEYRRSITERSEYSAKYPELRFEERTITTIIDESVLTTLNKLYDETEQLRLKRRL